MSKKRKLRVKNPQLLLLFLTAALAFDANGVLRIGLMAALLHESGHVLLYRAFFGEWPMLEISIFGICMRMTGKMMAAREELCLAAAGIACNAACAAAALWMMECWAGYCYAGYWFVACNILLAGVNLLPLPGLDGARIAGCMKDMMRV